LSLVSFVLVNNQEKDSMKEAIVRSLDLINFDFTRNIHRILIKPNMCYYYHPSTGEVTDPQFVSAIVDIFQERFNDPEISIVEADASAMKCKYAFSMLGYDRIVKEIGIKLINLCKEESTEISINIKGSKFDILIPNIFNKSDLIVNVPKIKYMDGVKISCALKNMFGCNANPGKYIYHKELNDIIVNINKHIKTNLVITDGLMVCGKYTKRLNMVMSSKDPVANDAAASRLMGLNPRSVKHIASASKNGVGNMEFNPVGDFNDFITKFPKRGARDDIRKLAASLYSRIFY